MDDLGLIRVEHCDLANLRQVQQQEASASAEGDVFEVAPLSPLA